MVTIKDIARAAGVSHTTVSRALAGSPLIKSGTRERIARIASEMNYIPNYSAKSLVLRKSHTIGLFFSSIEQGTTASFLVDAIKGIRQELDEDYILSVNGLDALKSFDSVVPGRYDGILLMSQSDEDNAFIYHAHQSGLPIVVLNRQLDDPSIASVAADDREGVAHAVDYAISRGRRRFALIEGRPGFRSSVQRKAGFMDGLIRRGVAMHPDCFAAGDYSAESGYEAMLRLLSLAEPPDTVFCSNDDMAFGAMKACIARGIAVPGQISFIGFDDSPFARYANPALTTVAKPVAEISRLGTAKLLERLRSAEARPEQLLVKTELRIRDSISDL